MEACRHVPVDVAYVIAVLVLAYFAEGHATPFECGVVLSGKDVVAQSAGFYLNLAYLFKYVLGIH